MNRELKTPGHDYRGPATRSLIYAVTAALIFALAEAPGIARGILLGSLFSAANFFLLGKTIALTMGRSPAKARGIGLVSILTRYVIMAIPLVVGIKSTLFDFVAVVVGLFSIQMVILAEFLVFRPMKGDNNTQGHQPRSRG